MQLINNLLKYKRLRVLSASMERVKRNMLAYRISIKNVHPFSLKFIYKRDMYPTETHAPSSTAPYSTFQRRNEEIIQSGHTTRNTRSTGRNEQKFVDCGIRPTRSFAQITLVGQRGKHSED